MKTLVATTVVLALLPVANLAQTAAPVETGSQSIVSATTEINQQASNRVDLNDIKKILVAKATAVGDKTPTKPCTQLRPMC